MASQKEMREFRELFNVANSEVVVSDFVFAGFIIDGAAFENENGDVVVVKTIAKKEGFDLNDAIAEFNEREAAALEREQARAQKALEKAEKEAAKLAAAQAKEAEKVAEGE